jgi:glycosyltransferase involved in cell wall biosynthesis
VMVIASLYSSEIPSGENLFVQNLTETFNKYGINCNFYTINTGKLSKSWIYTLKVTCIQLFNIGNSPSRAIKIFKPDIILVSNLFPNISTRWLKKNSAPVVYFQHNFRINCIAGTYSRNGKECFSCLSKNHLQGIKYGCYKQSRIASSIATIRFLTKRNRRIEMKYPKKFLALHKEAVQPLEMSGIKSSRIQVLNNYLPNVKIASHSGDRNAWIYCGRISEEKGILQLLEIWPNNQNLDVYGEGPLAAKLHELTRERPNLKYKGMIPNEKLTSVLDEYIGGVVPSSWREGFPMVVLEYLRAGVPIIATKGNNVSRIVEESKSGVQFKAGSREELLTAIETVLASRARFSINASQHFESRYSEEIWLNKLLSIIDQTLSESRCD